MSTFPVDTTPLIKVVHPSDRKTVSAVSLYRIIVATFQHMQ